MKKRSSFCPGFRFHPTDIELVMYYLKRKLLGKKLVPEVIADVNIYDFHPRDLSDKSILRNGDLEWFFFCPKSRKYSCGSRKNRGTDTGYWKATGKDREIKYKEKTVGFIKTLVFHLGRPPKGERTDWVMHEYRMEDNDLVNAGVVQDAYVLCRLFEKSGAGPKNGAQYGAPFKEEDWDDDDDVEASQFGMTNVTSTDPGPSTATFSENPRSLEISTVMSSEPFGFCEATNGLIPYASSSVAVNVTSLEPGPSTKTLVPYASSSKNAGCLLPADNDLLFTNADFASILHNNNVQATEADRKGKKIMTDAPNNDEVLYLDPRDMFTLDDFCQDGFTMFQDDGISDFPMSSFPADDLFDDLWKLDD